MTTTKKYATMAFGSTPHIVTAKSKKDAAEKLGVSTKEVYLYN